MYHIDEEINKLKVATNEMAVLVLAQIKKSVKAYIEFDLNLTREIALGEKRVNAYELKIDKDCENLFATQNPVAKDLRFAFSTIKINYNYERIGDQANGIANLVNTNMGEPDAELLKSIQFEKLIEVLMDMQKTIIKAYNKDDTQLARTVFNKDLFLDEINMKVAGIVAAYIVKNPSKAIDALNLLSIIRKIERVGDHITNIAEEIIFYIEGKVLKHGKKDNDLD